MVLSSCFPDAVSDGRQAAKHKHRAAKHKDRKSSSPLENCCNRAIFGDRALSPTALNYCPGACLSLSLFKADRVEALRESAGVEYLRKVAAVKGESLLGLSDYR